MSRSSNVWFHNERLAPGISVLGFYFAIPVSWQGWLVLALYVAAMVASVVMLVPGRWGMFLLVAAGLTLTLVLLAIAKGKRVEGIGP